MSKDLQSKGVKYIMSMLQIHTYHYALVKIAKHFPLELTPFHEAGIKSNRQSRRPPTALLINSEPLTVAYSQSSTSKFSCKYKIKLSNYHKDKINVENSTFSH